nr:MAG: peptidase [Microvirus sp.]
MEKLTEFFDYQEFGITDETEISIRENIKKLVINVMEKIRAEYGMPIYITSGYRTPEHNKKVGGVANSQHIYGEACDFTGRDFKRLLRIIDEMDDKGLLNYDQLIIYRKRQFIHVSYRNESINRNQFIIKF